MNEGLIIMGIWLDCQQYGKKKKKKKKKSKKKNGAQSPSSVFRVLR